MSKMSELDLCVGELRSAAQSLNSVADSLTSLFSGSQLTVDTGTDNAAGKLTFNIDEEGTGME